MNQKAVIDSFFHHDTNTVSYLVSDPSTRMAAIIDPVIDYSPNDGQVRFDSIDAILAFANEKKLTIAMVLETHIHADHLSAAHYIKQITHAKVGIGEHIREVQALFNPLFNLIEPATLEDFDLFFKDNETFALGELTFKVLHTPGHTPACITYCVDDAAFVGDTLFMPDYGTARADFPGGSADALYHSISRILALPPQTRLFLCHDYKPAGRDHFVWETTVLDQRKHNIHIHDGVSAAEFIQRRNERDATLDQPRLILPSLQINVRAGRFPAKEGNNKQYIKIPLTINSEKTLC